MKKNFFAERRKRLVEQLKHEGAIFSKKVEKAFLAVPREKYVPERLAEEAYIDAPLPTLEGQTISAPHMCAIMCEALDLNEGDKLLEIGTGSGYHSSLCAEIIFPEKKIGRGLVVSVEIFKSLSLYAKKNLQKASYITLVNLIVADGSSNLPFRTKFNKILVTAAAKEIPEHLIELLEPGGRMVVPVGKYFQDLKLIVKNRYGEIYVKSLGGCLFVPLRGLKGQQDDS